jgi:hypothetical protein
MFCTAVFCMTGVDQIHYWPMEGLTPCSGVEWMCFCEHIIRICLPDPEEKRGRHIKG